MGFYSASAISVQTNLILEEIQVSFAALFPKKGKKKWFLPFHFRSSERTAQLPQRRQLFQIYLLWLLRRWEGAIWTSEINMATSKWNVCARGTTVGLSEIVGCCVYATCKRRLRYWSKEHLHELQKLISWGLPTHKNFSIWQGNRQIIIRTTLFLLFFSSPYVAHEFMASSRFGKAK